MIRILIVLMFLVSSLTSSYNDVRHDYHVRDKFKKHKGEPIERITSTRLNAIESNICTDCKIDAFNNKIECLNKNGFNFNLFKANCLNNNSMIKFFQEASVLKINNYYFSYSLNENLFDYSMPNLKELDLSNNSINYLNSLDLFKNLPILTNIVLDDNRLIFENDINFKSLFSVSQTLKVLSLNRAFHGIEDDYDYDDDGDVDDNDERAQWQHSTELNINLKDLLVKSNLIRLEAIHLRNNSLKYFNFKNKTTSENDDILCLNKNLKKLNLKENFIEIIYFNTDCVQSNNNLEVIELNDNQLNDTIVNDDDFLKSLIMLKKNNFKFKIDLAFNKIRCDNCKFRKWLADNNNITSKIVDQYDQLSCIKWNEKNSTFAEVNYRQCNTTPNDNRLNRPYTWNQLRANTSNSTSNNNSHSNKFTLNRLIVFLITVITLCSLIIFLLNKNRKSLQRAQQARYNMLRQNLNTNESNATNTHNNSSNQEESLIETREYRDRNFDEYDRNAFKRAFKRVKSIFSKKQTTAVVYETFNDDYVVGASTLSLSKPIYKRYDSNNGDSKTDNNNNDNEEVIMDRSSLSGSQHNIFQSDMEVLVESPTPTTLILIRPIP